MPETFQVTLSDEAVRRLVPVRDKLTMEEWFVMIANAAAIGEEFAFSAAVIQKQADEEKPNEVATAIEAERQRLLAEVA